MPTITMPNGAEKEVTADQLDRMITAVENNLKRLQERALPRLTKRVAYLKGVRDEGTA